MSEYEGLVPAAAQPTNGGLPADVAAVWPNDQANVIKLIEAWGLDEFRASAIHQAALVESRRRPKPSLKPSERKKK